ncbi:DUF2254 domain-containing protein [Salipiger abyssi]|uniref:DUF2254 domain-containing protein n=1 Tax=Salipiger abyssi TaxID=1250539 RepID=UPI001A8F452C|nr:DUF2254 domain-containing protein [Salipiger abyssi]MBN9886000.1 DUF2254 domain-containing protein [Salipiger abyssi]
MTASKALLLLLRLARSLAARVMLGAVVALAVAFLSPLVGPLIPESWAERFGPDTVVPILTILATTMLTVTTFSLSVMVQAFQSAASQATPRAYRLHLADTTTQTVLATFTGAFLYALTALVMFRTGFYSDAVSVVILGVTVLVIGAIVLAILRWIDHLSTLGSMDNTLDIVEQHARDPLNRAQAQPALGGLPLAPDAQIPNSARPLPAPQSGYVQFVDMRSLHERLAAADARLTLSAAPGQHVIAGAPLGWLLGDGAEPDGLSGCFTIGKTRTAEQDARFGIVVLSEIALRALSPGINDPGTAIDVSHRVTRLLAGIEAPGTTPPDYPRIEVPVVAAPDLIEDGYHPLIRAGAAHPEVIGVVLDSLATLEASDWPELAQAARQAQGYALRHAKSALTVADDRDALARKYGG